MITDPSGILVVALYPRPLPGESNTSNLSFMFLSQMSYNVSSIGKFSVRPEK